MTPIPLTSPAGAVYAYACSRCHHVSGGSELLVREAVTGPHEQLVESSLRGAERCCLCHGCGVELGDNAWLGECGACGWLRSFSRLWLDIGTALVWRITTDEEWQRHFRQDDDDEDE